MLPIEKYITQDTLNEVVIGIATHIVHNQLARQDRLFNGEPTLAEVEITCRAVLPHDGITSADDVTDLIGNTYNRF